MSSERFIRVYCPTHKTSTTATAAPVVICESGGHALSQGFPHAEFWEYCCDCQSFRPSEIAASGRAQERCMVCDRPVARRFLCGHCQVISIESDEASKRRKPYVVTPVGVVEPACPGCLRAAISPVHAHACREVDATLSTAREVCPFCNESVKPKPAPQPVPTQAVTTPLKPHGGGRPVETRRCFNCGAPAPDEFCPRCGAPQSPAGEWRGPAAEPRDEPPPAVKPAAPAARQSAAVAAPVSTGSPAKGVVVFLAAVAALVVLVVIALSLSKRNANTNTNVYSYNSNSTYAESTETKLERAIASGNLVQPSGTSAKDYYDQLLRESPSSAKLSSLRDRLVPALKARPMQLLADFYKPGTPAPLPEEWEEAAKMLTWASQMSPGDSALEARAVYCTGRLAYIKADKAGARKLWQRAGELDTSWALPQVGIGITYNDVGEYSEAIPYFDEAARRDSAWAVPYHNLGSSYRGLREFETARENFERAVRLAPRWGLPHVRLGDMALAQKDCATAAAEYKAVLDVVTPGTRGWDLDEIRRKHDNAAAGRGCY